MAENQSVDDDDLALDTLLEKQHLHDDDGNENESRLESFRQEWHRELRSGSNSQIQSNESSIQGSPYKNNAAQLKENSINNDISDKEKEATEYFNHAVELERKGHLYEAIQFYRRAMILVPDIEFKVHRLNTNDNLEIRNDNESLSGLNSGQNQIIDEDCDLYTKFRSEILPTDPFCTPNFQVEATHISCLPPEMLEKILFWVISEDLDIRSLDKTSAICKGFYLFARRPDIWKKISQRIWGANINTFHPFSSWREMVIKRSRPRLDGCYISCTTYYQSGESSFRDQSYQPWHVVKYYRYVRFFPDGDAMMLTSSEEPQQVINLFKTKELKHQQSQMLLGHYCLKNNKILLEFTRKVKAEKIINRTKGRQRGGTNDVKETNFSIIFELANVNKKCSWKLIWDQYKITSKYYDNRQYSTNVDISNLDNFPVFYFSRVKSFSAESNQSF